MTEAEEGWFAAGRATPGDRIAAARPAAGLSQADGARRPGVRPATLRAREDDRAEPRANRLQMPAGMPGVSLRWTTTGAGDGPDPDAATPPDLRAAPGEMRAPSAEAQRLADRIAQAERRPRPKPEARA